MPESEENTMKSNLLEKKITNFAKKFGIHRAFCGEEFFYVIKDEDIEFSIYTNEREPAHIEFINNKYDTDIADWYFVFSVLHEIGHHQTIKLLTKEDWIIESIVRRKHNQIAYWNLKAEDLANRWAIQYLIDHTEECWNFQKECYEIMRQM